MAKKKKVLKKDKNDFRKFVKWFWMAIISIPIFLTLLIFVTWLGLFGKIPSIEQIADPQTKLASQIISYDGELIGKYYQVIQMLFIF